MNQNDKNPEELNNKRRKAAKDIVRGIVKFCVGAFFGATAAYVTRESAAPKFERYSIVAGGTLVGLYVGDQVSDRFDLRIDNVFERMQRLQEANEGEG